MVQYFFYDKKFIWPIWSITFCRNVFIFSYSNMITNFKFKIFINIFYSNVNVDVLVLRSVGFIMIVLHVLSYSLTISSHLSIKHVLKLKSYICRYYSLSSKKIFQQQQIFPLQCVEYNSMLFCNHDFSDLL